MRRAGRASGAASAGITVLAMLGLVVAANAGRYGALAAIAGGLVAGGGIWTGRHLFRRSADSETTRES